MDHTGHSPIGFRIFPYTVIQVKCKTHPHGMSSILRTFIFEIVLVIVYTGERDLGFLRCSFRG